MNILLDTKTLSQRTGIQPRSIRYVLDHELVPSPLLVENVPILGGTRVMNEDIAVYIACAGYLLELGFRGGAVLDIMSAFSIHRARNQLHPPIFEQVVRSHKDGRVQYADKRYVRWIVDEKPGDWFDRRMPKAKVVDLIPQSCFELNVGAMATLVRGSDSSEKQA